MMRYGLVAAALLALAGCGAPTSSDTGAAETTPSASTTPAGFTLESEAVVGQWSFDRTCGVYDIVLYADANADYFDYDASGHVTSYGGQWTEDLATKRVTLEVRRLDAENAATGDPITYTLDITAPVTDDLVGHFARADGAGAREINALRCPEEDRE